MNKPTLTTDQNRNPDRFLLFADLFYSPPPKIQIEPISSYQFAPTTHSIMATPPPPTTSNQQRDHEPHLHIKSAARKLPIKRKANHHPPTAAPNPNTPNCDRSFSIIVDDGDELDDDDDGEDDSNTALTDVNGSGCDGNDSGVPFKFHRIWSESDEVRFLQGLLACRTQGLVFPRDLNVFFDRFSETMTQPYTRSQLSEKLRRLRKKFRVVSSRVTRGLNPSTALSSHDRDLYHLSAQLWHPSYADSSPFVSSGPDASKRRRRLPPPPPSTSNKAMLASPVTLPPPAAPVSNAETKVPDDRKQEVLVGEQMTVENGVVCDGNSIRHRILNAVLDALDNSVNNTKANLLQSSSLLQLDHTDNVSFHGDLLKRWLDQRAAEVDVFAQRLRLVIENQVQH